MTLYLNPEKKQSPYVITLFHLHHFDHYKGVFLLLCVFILCALLWAPLLWANDSSFGGTASNLIPLKNEEIQMTSEEIVVHDRDGYWNIHATYLFTNQSSAQQKVQMGFPEQFCEPGHDCNSPTDPPYLFDDLKIMVDGRPAQITIGKLDPNSKWKLGRIHLFDVDFAPQAQVKIVHTYRMGISGSIAGEHIFDYVTLTGTLWKGPIQNARFLIRLKERPFAFFFPKSYTLVDYKTIPTSSNSKKKETLIEFKQTQWTPTQDLHLTLVGPFSTHFGCPNPVASDFKIAPSTLKSPTLKQKVKSELRYDRR